MKKRTYASVWDALGDAANIRMRAQLMIEVEQYVKKSGLSQTAVAKRLGVTQPRLNDLLRGKIDKFSLDALVNMLNAAGRQVSLRVKKAA
ncbi:MAG: XRE family transcriptional regulator [Pseudomonadota bacterium]